MNSKPCCLQQFPLVIKLSLRIAEKAHSFKTIDVAVREFRNSKCNFDDKAHLFQLINHIILMVSLDRTHITSVCFLKIYFPSLTKCLLENKI